MINIVVLMGRIVREAEVKETQSGAKLCTFTLAVDRAFTKKGEERKTDFIDVTAWGNTAEFVSKYFRKGSIIVVEGNIQINAWTDDKNKSHKKINIVASRVHFGSSKSDEYDTPEIPEHAQTFGKNTESNTTPSYREDLDDDSDDISDDDELPF